MLGEIMGPVGGPGLGPGGPPWGPPRARPCVYPTGLTGLCPGGPPLPKSEKIINGRPLSMYIDCVVEINLDTKHLKN